MMNDISSGANTHALNLIQPNECQGRRMQQRPETADDGPVCGTSKLSTNESLSMPSRIRTVSVDAGLDFDAIDSLDPSAQAQHHAHHEHEHEHAEASRLQGQSRGRKGHASRARDIYGYEIAEPHAAMVQAFRQERQPNSSNLHGSACSLDHPEDDCANDFDDNDVARHKQEMAHSTSSLIMDASQEAKPSSMLAVFPSSGDQAQASTKHAKYPRRGSLDSSTLIMSREREQQRVKERLREKKKWRLRQKHQQHKLQEQPKQHQPKPDHAAATQRPIHRAPIEHAQSIVSTTTATTVNTDSSRPTNSADASALGYEYGYESPKPAPNRRRMHRRRCSVTKFSLEAAEAIKEHQQQHQQQEQQQQHIIEHKSSSLPCTPVQKAKQKVDGAALEALRSPTKQKRRSSLDMMMQHKRQQEQRFLDEFHNPNLLHQHIAQHSAHKNNNSKSTEEKSFATCTTSSTNGSNPPVSPHKTKKHRLLGKKSLNMLFGAFRRSNRKLMSRSNSSSNLKQGTDDAPAPVKDISREMASTVSPETAAHAHEQAQPPRRQRAQRAQRRGSVTKFSLEATEQIRQEFQ